MDVNWANMHTPKHVEGCNPGMIEKEYHKEMDFLK
jgi:hypothetical protein